MCPSVPSNRGVVTGARPARDLARRRPPAPPDIVGINGLYALVEGMVAARRTDSDLVAIKAALERSG